MRLDKFVSDALGVTRSEARDMIRRGGFTADGAPLGSPAAHVDCQEIRYKGEKISAPDKIYIMMNKPAGVLSATEDKTQRTVLDLLPERYRRYGLFPAGRLDKDTEGFLLLTNDGALAHKVLSPKKKVGKTYVARLSRELTAEKIYVLENGVDIGGYVTRPCQVELLDPLTAKITVVEGKFHQVKKMFLAVDNHVEALRRVSFAGLELDGSLAPGEFRELCTKELGDILRTIQ